MFLGVKILNLNRPCTLAIVQESEFRRASVRRADHADAWIEGHGHLKHTNIVDESMMLFT